MQIGSVATAASAVALRILREWREKRMMRVLKLKSTPSWFIGDPGKRHRTYEFPKCVREMLPSRWRHQLLNKLLEPLFSLHFSCEKNGLRLICSIKVNSAVLYCVEISHCTVCLRKSKSSSAWWTYC